MSQYLKTIFDKKPYEIATNEKDDLLLREMNELHEFHSKNCKEYKSICRALGISEGEFNSLKEFPMLPVSIFKELDIKSIKDEDVVRILYSSGTTSMKKSKIYLDAMTSANQTKALTTIVNDFIGKNRIPMIIVDSRSTITNKNNFSARAAGIVGMLTFGKDYFYLLKDDDTLDITGLEVFLDKYGSQPIIIFGFTFMVWKYLYQELIKTKNSQVKINLKDKLNNAVLIHSGGWKKLLNEKVDNITFKNILKEELGIKKVHNFYGMVEQVGSVFMECEEGYFHTSNFSEVLIRNHLDWSVEENGKEGIIEVISVLPQSYPGNVLLTEDIGVIHGVDDCKCKRMGKYFTVKGRVEKAEVRGCSDTYELKEVQNYV